ncbi:MAG: hypothetical protein KDB03_10600 [Planctomycetales bacterium]|nr:hypothetical protein [Planctomycetales bacterium]
MNPVTLRRCTKVCRAELVLCKIMVTCFLLTGCRPSQTIGGDTPLTTQRLSNSKLVEIHGDLSWTFDGPMVVIEDQSSGIPSDLVETLLGEVQRPNRIEANWQLDEEANFLRVWNMVADSKQFDLEARLPVRPAGHVRIDIGGRQYNLFHDTEN